MSDQDIKPEIRKVARTLSLKQFVRGVLKQSYQELRETSKEIKDMLRSMEQQNRDLDNLTEAQLRVLFAGEIIDGYDKLASETELRNSQGE